MTAAAAVVVWAAFNLPVAVLAPDNWSWFFVFSRARAANPESLWNIALDLSDNRLLDGPLAGGEVPTLLNAAVAVSLLAFGAGILWLVLAAPVRPRVAQVAFLLVAGFLLLNKVYSPQYSLWLLPLAVLARPRWRSLLLWQATEALVWTVTMLHYLGRPTAGSRSVVLPRRALRDAAVLVLIALVVRDVLRPDGDVVRTSWPGVDDPAGGPLDRAPDRLTLRGFRVVRVGSVPQGFPEQGDLLGVVGGVSRGLEDDGAVGGPRDLDQ